MVPITIILIFFSAAIIASVIPQDNSFVNAASVETLESSQDNLDEETDISSSLYPKCTADTFGEEDDVENTQNSQIFPRANACPVSGMITMPEAPPNKKEAPSADSKLQEAIPAHLSPLPEHRLCDFLHRHHLSCGGPVVQRNAFIFVMNCLTGKFSKSFAVFVCSIQLLCFFEFIEHGINYFRYRNGRGNTSVGKI